MEEYAIYLRKSRADVEAEARGEGETLARHRAALMALADREGMHVARVYQEIVSGDTIDARPQMQALLSAVQEGQYAGVICNDIDRLSRGDMIDQGIIQRAFMETGTLIITPGKIYDPRNDADSTYFEMGQFIARMEYRQIKKRLQMGRVRAAAEGNVQSGRTPYGYRKVPNGRGGSTYEPDPEAASTVKQMYDWYSGEGGEKIGCKEIANRLNAMGIRTQSGKPWYDNSIANLLQNPVYTGRYTWQAMQQSTTYIDGQKVKKYRKNKSPIIVEGAIPPLVSKEVWDRVQAEFAARKNPRVNAEKELKNPLAGLIRCARCGRMLNRITHREHETLMCRTVDCPTRSIVMGRAEEMVLEALQGITQRYNPKQPAQRMKNTREPKEKAIKKRIAALNDQMTRLFELVEQGIYSPQDFVSRRAAVQEQIAQAQAELEELRREPDPEIVFRDAAPTILRVLDAYQYAETVAQKNELLKSIIDHIDYSREGKEPPKMIIYPRIIVYKD